METGIIIAGFLVVTLYLHEIRKELQDIRSFTMMTDREKDEKINS